MDRGLFLSRADWTTRFPPRFDFRLVGKAPSRWAPNYRLTFSRALALSVRRADPKALGLGAFRSVLPGALLRKSTGMRVHDCPRRGPFRSCMPWPSTLAREGTLSPVKLEDCAALAASGHSEPLLKPQRGQPFPVQAQVAPISGFHAKWHLRSVQRPTAARPAEPGCDASRPGGRRDARRGARCEPGWSLAAPLKSWSTRRARDRTCTPSLLLSCTYQALSGHWWIRLHGPGLVAASTGDILHERRQSSSRIGCELRGDRVSSCDRKPILGSKTFEICKI